MLNENFCFRKYGTPKSLRTMTSFCFPTLTFDLTQFRDRPLPLPQQRQHATRQMKPKRNDADAAPRELELLGTNLKEVKEEVTEGPRPHEEVQVKVKEEPLD